MYSGLRESPPPRPPAQSYIPTEPRWSRCPRGLANDYNKNGRYLFVFFFHLLKFFFFVLLRLPVITNQYKNERASRPSHHPPFSKRNIMTNKHSALRSVSPSGQLNFLNERWFNYCQALKRIRERVEQLSDLSWPSVCIGIHAYTNIFTASQLGKTSLLGNRFYNLQFTFIENVN